MKKYVIKATALAIGALVGGAAVASVDFSASPFVATTDSFASELNYAATTGTAISGAKTVVTKLGFGVSAGQTRFIRVDLTGAKLAAVAAAGNVTNTTSVPAANNFANVAVVQGGNVGDTYVIYQVTGSNAGHAATDITTIVLPNLNVTNGNAAPVNVSYALYADPVAAANQTAGQSLSSQSGALFGFKSGISFKTTTTTQTAAVVDAYKKFVATPANVYGPVNIGKIDYAPSNAFDATGLALNSVAPAPVGQGLAALVQATSTIKVTGDFTFTKADPTAPTATKLFLSTTADCTGAPTAFDVIGADLLSATVNVGSTATSKYVCVTNANGGSITPVALTAQTFSADYNPVAVTGNTVADPAAVTLGSIVRDGTTLTAPFVTIHPDYLSRVVLNSSYGADVPVTATVTAEGGATCTGSAYSTTLKAKSQLVINVKDICPALSSGLTRFAVTVSVAAPRSNIDGVYNVMNYDVTTGKTNSLISYVMVVPGTN